FQAEDGIRDRNVTGVQTCALPIYPEELIGKTITIRQTIGQARVLVPDDIPTHAEGSVTVGNSELFGSRISGTRIKNTQDNGNGPGLTLNISQRIGSIEVIRR